MDEEKKEEINSKRYNGLHSRSVLSVSIGINLSVLIQKFITVSHVLQARASLFR